LSRGGGGARPEEGPGPGVAATGLGHAFETRNSRNRRHPVIIDPFPNPAAPGPAASSTREPSCASPCSPPTRRPPRPCPPRTATPVEADAFDAEAAAAACAAAQAASPADAALRFHPARAQRRLGDAETARRPLKQAADMAHPGAWHVLGRLFHHGAHAGRDRPAALLHTLALYGDPESPSHDPAKAQVPGRNPAALWMRRRSAGAR